MNEDKLMRASTGLLIFAGMLIVLGQLLAHTAIGQVTPSENVGAWVAVILGGIVLAFAATVAAVRIGKALVRRPAQQPANMNAATPAAQPQPARQSTRRTYNYEDLQW